MRTGRRPKRSDNAPSNGANRNCISAQVVPNRPKISAPLAGSPPTKLTTSPGSTGIMMPDPRVCKRTVGKMNARAALLAPVLVSVSTLGGSWVSSVNLWDTILDVSSPIRLELLLDVGRVRPLLQASEAPETESWVTLFGLFDHCWKKGGKEDLPPIVRFLLREYRLRSESDYLSIHRIVWRGWSLGRFLQLL